MVSPCWKKISYCLIKFYTLASFVNNIYSINLKAITSTAVENIVLQVGKHRELSYQGIKSISVGNSRIVEVKKFPVENQILVYGIMPGHTNLIIKYKNKKPPMLVNVIVQPYEQIDKRKRLRRLLSKSPRLSISQLDDELIVQGILGDIRQHNLLINLIQDHNISLHYSFSSTLCESVYQLIVKELKELKGGEYVFSLQDPCVINISGKVWDQDKFQRKLGEYKKLYGSALKMIDFTTMVQKEPLLIETKLAFVVHTQGVMTDIGINHTQPVSLVNLYRSSFDFAKVLNPMLHTLEKTGRGKIVNKPVILSTNGKKSSFIAKGSKRGQRSFGISVNLTASLINNSSISSEIEIEIITPDPIKHRQRNFFQGTLIIENGKTLMISGMTSEQTVKKREGFAFLSSIPVVGLLFKQLKNDNVRSELTIFITQKTINKKVVNTKITPNRKKAISP